MSYVFVIYAQRGEGTFTYAALSRDEPDASGVVPIRVWEKELLGSSMPVDIGTPEEPHVVVAPFAPSFDHAIDALASNRAEAVQIPTSEFEAAGFPVHEFGEGTPPPETPEQEIDVRTAILDMYPQHKLLSAVLEAGGPGLISGFLEQIAARRTNAAALYRAVPGPRKRDGTPTARLVPLTRNDVKALLYEFFGIDASALALEKRQMERQQRGKLDG